MRQFILAASIMALSSVSSAYAQNAEPVDEIITKGTIQTDPAMSAWNAGDYETAEAEFKKNAFCALRSERNFQSALESSRESSINASVATGIGDTAGASNGGAASSSAAATNPATRLSNNNFKNKISATKRTCNNRGFQIYMTGLSQLKLGKRTEAKKSFERAAAMRGDLFDAHFRLSLLEYQDGDIKRAEKHYKKLKKLETKYKKGNAKEEIQAQIAYLGNLLG